MAEMDDSVVGAYPPGRADDHKVCRLDSRHHPEEGGPVRHSLARPPQKPCFGGWSGGGFDAGKLHSQLADLLQLYLARASEPDAVEKCSARDALACAKTLTAMMSDVQSGKPASVDSDTQWPRICRVRSRAAPSSVSGGAGACPPELQRRRGSPVIPRKKAGLVRLPAPSVGRTSPAGPVRNLIATLPLPSLKTLYPLSSRPTRNPPSRSRTCALSPVRTGSAKRSGSDWTRRHLAHPTHPMRVLLLLLATSPPACLMRIPRLQPPVPHR